MPVCLLVDDDADFREPLATAWRRRAGLQVVIAADGAAALAASAAQALTKPSSISRLARESGLELIEPLLAQHPRLRIVVLTGYASIATSVQAIKLGAHYLTKPARVDDILAALAPSHRMPRWPRLTTPTPLDQVEWEYIQRTLPARDGNISAAVKRLGSHRRTLQRKLQKRPSTVTERGREGDDRREHTRRRARTGFFTLHRGALLRGLLAYLGADVIRIEKPGGSEDRYRPGGVRARARSTWKRGATRGMTLDLSTLRRSPSRRAGAQRRRGDRQHATPARLARRPRLRYVARAQTRHHPDHADRFRPCRALARSGWVRCGIGQVMSGLGLSFRYAGRTGRSATPFADFGNAALGAFATPAASTSAAPRGRGSTCRLPCSVPR